MTRVGYQSPGFDDETLVTSGTANPTHQTRNFHTFWLWFESDRRTELNALARLGASFGFGNRRFPTDTRVEGTRNLSEWSLFLGRLKIELVWPLTLFAILSTFQRHLNLQSQNDSEGIELSDLRS